MKVDIIIPAYNPGSYIVDALNSCFNQSYRNYTVTIIDDSSTEDLSYLIKKFPKTKMLRTNQNSGPSIARNLGIQSNNGELVSLLDADDIMHQDKLMNSVLSFKKEKDIGMTCGNYQILVNRSRLIRPFYKRAPVISWKSLMRQNYVASGSVTIKRSVLDDVGLFDERFWIGEDAELWLRISEKYRIKYIHKVLYYYSKITNGNSLTDRQDIQEKHLENLKIMKRESKERMTKSS